MTLYPVLRALAPRNVIGADRVCERRHRRRRRRRSSRRRPDYDVTMCSRRIGRIAVFKGSEMDLRRLLSVMTGSFEQLNFWNEMRTRVVLIIRSFGRIGNSGGYSYDFQQLRQSRCGILQPGSKAHVCCLCFRK